MRDKDEGTEGVREVALNWAQDLPDRAVDDPAIGPARRVDIAGRCADCWGQCLLLVDGNDRHIGLACRVCEQRVDEEHVELELKRMQIEVQRNLPGVRIGRAAEYHEQARFVLKLLPDMDRNKAEFNRRVAAAKEEVSTKRKGKGKLSRGDFDEAGTPGLLFFQASALVSGVEALPREISAISISDIDFEKLAGVPDVSAVDEQGQLQVSGAVSIPKPDSEGRIERMGAAMVAGFGAAFACEVGMKAILLTRLDEAEKSHDLWTLYSALPEDCRMRLQGDFPRIANIMKRYRDTFAKWRYFEPSAGQDALSVLVNLEQIRGLEKAAKVIRDEGVIAGLQYDINAEYEYDYDFSFYLNDDLTVATTPDIERESTKISLGVRGHETAVAWREILSLSDYQRNPS